MRQKKKKEKEKIVHVLNGFQHIDVFAKYVR